MDRLTEHKMTIPRYRRTGDKPIVSRKPEPPPEPTGPVEPAEPAAPAG